MNRIERLHTQILAKGSGLRSQINNNNNQDEDIVIVAAKRTAITRAKRGGFKDTTPDVLLGGVLQEVLKETKVSPNQVGDVVVGNVLLPGAGAGMARMAQLASGFPHTVPLHTVNRQCSSGLQAVADVVANIKAGHYDIGIAAGIESMTFASMNQEPPPVNWDHIMETQDAMDCTIPMGITSDNVASKYNIPRPRQEEFAVLSHTKAAQAQANGWFKNEIVPITTILKDKEGNEKTVTIAQDDGIRKDTTTARLGKLRPAFQENGTTTAGTSSQVSDGAAAVLIMKRSTAKSLGVQILGRFISYAVVGVPPSTMGVGPAFAIPEAVKKANLSLGDIDVYEINEAFASQAIYCVEKLGIPIEKVNPKGGAIALGHPLGCTGARQVATLLHELKRRNERYGVISMCIGTGMGAAAVFERVE